MIKEARSKKQEKRENLCGIEKLITLILRRLYKKKIDNKDYLGQICDYLRKKTQDSVTEIVTIRVVMPPVSKPKDWSA
jgi:hypothetical protein